MNSIALPGRAIWRPVTLCARGEALAARGGLVLLALALFVFLTVPLAMLFARSVEGRAGEWVGIANFVQYVQSPALARSTWNTLTFAVLTTLVTVPLAFVFAYAIQRSCIPFKSLWRNVAMIPILAPSLLAAISFIYLFGNQGAFKFTLAWVGLDIDLRHAGHGAGDDVRIVPARGDDPDGGARACRTRGFMKPPTRSAPVSVASS